MKLFLDIETRSTVPIKSGAHAYAEKAEILIITYAIDDGPVEIYETSDSEGIIKLSSACLEADEHWWHNGGMFDRVVIAKQWPFLYTLMPGHKWRDTLVQAHSHSLPGSLGALCKIYGLPSDVAKDKAGRALIQLFCVKPQKNGEWATKDTHPDKWEQFREYAKSDIRAMRELHRLMPKRNYPNNESELAFWHLDQRINMRGVGMDVDMAAAAVRAIEKEQKVLAARTSEITEGEVAKATQRDRLLIHLFERYGAALSDLKKSTLEKQLNNPDLPDALRELLKIRISSTMTSSAKYKTLLRGVSPDGRLRGLMQFCGAHRTGRIAHRLFQPGNMPRPDVGLIKAEMGITGKILEADGNRYIDTGVAALKADCADMLFTNVMGLTANLVRSVIQAPPGKKLVISDWSNIEGRSAAFLTGEDWKLKAFRDYDAGIGADLYKLTYARSFGVDVESVDKGQRQLGKIEELALAYEGGVGAFVTFTQTYNMELEDIRKAVFANIDGVDPILVREAYSAWEWAQGWTGGPDRTMGLPQHVYIACDIVKRAWRKAHPATAPYWKELKEKIREAILNPGLVVKARLINIRSTNNWLSLRLPSGRYLYYAQPKVDEGGGISYMGVNQFNRKWGRIKSYGGKFFENLCQAFARDVLMYSLPKIEAAGYEVILTLHDEPITQAPDSPEFNAAHLSKLLSTNEDWNIGLPLAAEGFEAYRYKKEIE